MLANFGQCEWMENFRMSRETFYFLCEKLRPSIQKQNTRMRRPVSIEYCVAITLCILSTPSEYHTVAHLFVIPCSTVCHIVKETCRAIVRTLLPVYLKSQKEMA